MPKQDVGYLIKSINDKLKVKADADLKNYNLTFTQSRVFAYLSSKGGLATQKEIEQFLNVSHPTVVGIVTRMEQNGHVCCWIDADNRNKIVKLTRMANEIGRDMEEHMQENERHLLSPLSPEEVKQLKAMLMAIYNHLES